MNIIKTFKENSKKALILAGVATVLTGLGINHFLNKQEPKLDIKSNVSCYADYNSYGDLVLSARDGNYEQTIIFKNGNKIYESKAEYGSPILREDGLMSGGNAMIVDGYDAYGVHCVKNAKKNFSNKMKKDVGPYYGINDPE